jgi:hypothetical protein
MTEDRSGEVLWTCGSMGPVHYGGWRSDLNATLLVWPSDHELSDTRTPNATFC